MIRGATIADVNAIRALLKSVAGLWDDSWRDDVLERALTSTETVALVHVDGESVDGFICAHDVGFRAYVSELVVSPSVQGGGIGSGLLSEVERRLSRRGCSIAIADVWRDAEPFYRSHGWTPPPVCLLRKRLAGGSIEPTTVE
jgi:GNAT superfamily N-acetyltransferase